MNRLSNSISPYLQSHAENPVEWWPWCDDAFAEARARDVPVFLSVGYAACHWCHVMAHESFEDQATAEILNEHFVAVKVDREERPDVDAVFMAATQALTGQGGWPMSVFLTPDRRPFYAGTYFPPRPGHGLPAFADLLDAVSSAWRDRRSEVLSSAEHIAGELAARHAPKLPGEVTAADLDQARAELRSTYDQVRGGFGGAPKFPPSMVLEGLLRLGDEESLAMVDGTCRAMARGGIYDQLAGGFARYSVDAGWVVPHFEKMLYDNALLLGVYTHWWRVRPNPIGERVVAETIDWLVTEMRTPEGAYAASLDADSLDADGHTTEGAYYAWDRGQFFEALGPEDGAWAAEIFGVTESGTFEHGRSTLRLLGDPDPVRLADVRNRLQAIRSQRPSPERDDKVVAAWNGWLIEALVQAAGVFDRPEWLDLARDAADLVWGVHWVDGRLRRTSRDGVVGDSPGALEDYAAMVLACTRLAMADADPTWLGRAEQLSKVIGSAFADGDGFFDTATGTERLYLRPQDPSDNATPSGLSTAVHALRLLGTATGRTELIDRADRAAATAGGLVSRAPRFAGWLLAAAASRMVRPPVEVAIVGDPTVQATRALVRTAYRLAPAGSVIVAGRPDADGLALLADRSAHGGRSTAYVCRGFVCRLPVTDTDELAAQLRTP
ncbi:MAG: thioredoxin domain-containing protein [Microlunatus sp.]|nr:thioredoxin domain-containing protein [Microlunatus sp.]MDN5770866.1 thioredoxin domain-containing protein [Microlunatus sp.]